MATPYSEADLITAEGTFALRTLQSSDVMWIVHSEGKYPPYRLSRRGAIDWTLSDTATGARITGGRVQNFTAFAATGSTVSGLAAEEDAAYRLMRLLADQIVTRLVAEAARLP